jgi:hypothetical protein
MDSEKGLKFKGNKPRAGTVINVFPKAIMAIGECIREGAKKYPDPNNWKKVENAEVEYFDSLGRHLCYFNMGEELDYEDNLPHLAHAAWNALAILELYLTKTNYQFPKK